MPKKNNLNIQRILRENKAIEPLMQTKKKLRRPHNINSYNNVMLIMICKFNYANVLFI